MDLEVIPLHLPLRPLDTLGDEGMCDDLAFLNAQAVHNAGDSFGPEQTHQIVLEGQVEFRTAGISLAARSAPQLPVDPAGFVPLGTDNMEAARYVFFALVRVYYCAVSGRPLGFAAPDGALVTLDDGLAELDVGAAAGHVGGNRHRARLSGICDDLRFLLVLLGVQHVVFDTAPLQIAA